MTHHRLPPISHCLLHRLDALSCAVGLSGYVFLCSRAFCDFGFGVGGECGDEALDGFGLFDEEGLVVFGE
jgi:hypothetical protein